MGASRSGWKAGTGVSTWRKASESIRPIGIFFRFSNGLPVIAPTAGLLRFPVRVALDGEAPKEVRTTLDGLPSGVSEDPEATRASRHPLRCKARMNGLFHPVIPRHPRESGEKAGMTGFRGACARVSMTVARSPWRRTSKGLPHRLGRPRPGSKRWARNVRVLTMIPRNRSR